MGGEKTHTHMVKIARGESAQELARRIVLQLVEKGAVELKASGPGICTLFDSIRIASEILGVQTRVRIKSLSPAFRSSTRETVIIVEVSLAGSM